MSKSKKLQKQIEIKLEKLSKLLDQIDEARIIDSDDPETWEVDLLYNLAGNLKETLKLLEDQVGKQLNEWGEPIVLETGLCSLVDEYQEEDENEDI